MPLNKETKPEFEVRFFSDNRYVSVFNLKKKKCKHIR